MKPTDKLSTNFTLAELTVSDTAVRKNYTEQFNPPDNVITALTELCKNILQPLRNTVNASIKVTSGYRCERTNKAIGGAKTSQHIDGEAADINIEGMSVEEVYLLIKNSNLPFDQVIQEFDAWVHVSYNSTKNRKMCLRAVKKNGKTIYIAD